MAATFNLTAQLNLRGPANVNQITSRLRQQLGSVNVNVGVNINQGTARNVAGLNSSLQTLNNTLRQTNSAATAASTAINNLVSAGNNLSNLNMGQQLNTASTAAQQLATNTAAAGQTVTQARTQMEEFGRQSALAVRRFAAFSFVTSSIFAVTNAINKGVAAFIDYDRQLVKLQQITGESRSGLQALSNQISSLSRGLGVSSSELINVSSTLAQAGLSARDTEKALKALALSALAPSFDNLNKTVEGSIALMRQFGVSAGELEKALGSVNAVAAKFAVESGDIIAAIQRTGGVFASASKGVSEGTDALNEFIAIFTSVRATTRESAETIATGLRTIFTRIQRGSTIEALKEFGVTLTDAEGKFVGAYKAIELLSKGLSTIDPRDIKFSDIVEELGGFRQIGKVIPLIQQFSTAQEALKAAQQGQSSLAEDAATAQQSLAVQFSKVREEFLTLIREIGGSATFQALAKGALSLANALIKIADAVKDILPIVGIMAAMRGFSAMRQFGSGFIGGFRNPRGNAQGGLIKAYKKGGMVDVALMPGETVVSPEEVKNVGVSKLRQINHADKRKKFSIGGYAKVPGVGRTDSFNTQIPEGSFVIRTDATKALGGTEGVAAAARRKKFARGGVATIESSRRYVQDKFNKTYDKPKGLSISEAVKNKKEKLILNARDEIHSSIQRKPIDINTLGLDDSNPYYKAYSEAKNSYARGRAFEDLLLAKKIVTSKAKSKTARLDAMQNDTLVEIKSTKEQVSTKSLLDKIAGAIFRPRDRITDQVASNRVSAQQLSNKKDILKPGNLIVYEDATRLAKFGKEHKSQEEIEKKEQRFAKKRSTKKRFFGGLIQHLAEGDLATSKQVGFIKSLFSQYEKASGSVHPALQAFDPAETNKNYASTLINRLKTHISQADIIKKYGLRYDDSFGDFVVQKQSLTVGTPDIRPLSKFQGEDIKLIGDYQKKGNKVFGERFPSSQKPSENSRSMRMMGRYGYGRRYAFGGLVQRFAEGTDWPVKQVRDRKTGEYKNKRFTQTEIVDQLGGGSVVMRNYGVKNAMMLKKLLHSQANLSPEDVAKREQILKDFTSAVAPAAPAAPAATAAPAAPASTTVAQKRNKKNEAAFRELPEDKKINVASLKGNASYKVLENEKGEKVGLEKKAIDKGLSARIQAITRKYNMAMTKEIGELIAKRAGTTASVDKKTLKAIYANMTRSQAEGVAFESALAAAGAGVQPKGKRPIDYQAGLGPGLSKLFGFEEDRPTEAKASTLKASGERRKQQYFEGVKRGRLGRAQGGEVPIMAQEGEYVINKASAQAIGYQNLDNLNRYHDGGVVQSFKKGTKKPVRRDRRQQRTEDNRKAKKEKKLREQLAIQKEEKQQVQRTRTRTKAEINRDFFAANPQQEAKSKADVQKERLTRRAAKKGVIVRGDSPGRYYGPGGPDGGRLITPSVAISTAEDDLARTQTGGPKPKGQKQTKKSYLQGRNQAGVERIARAEQAVTDAKRQASRDSRLARRAAARGVDLATAKTGRQLTVTEQAAVSSRVAESKQRNPNRSQRTAAAKGVDLATAKRGPQLTATEQAEASTRRSAEAKAAAETRKQRTERVQRGRNSLINYGRGLQRQGYQTLNADKSGQGLFKSLAQNTKGLAQSGAGSLITSVGKMGKVLTNTGSDLGKFGKSTLANVKNMTSLTTIGGKLNYSYNNYLNSITKASTATGKLQAAFNPVTSTFKTLTTAAAKAASQLGITKPAVGGGAGGGAGVVGTPGAFGFPKTGTNPNSRQNKGLGGLYRKGKAAVGGMFGGRGGGGGMGSSMMLGMAAPMIADMFTVEDPQSATQASQSAMASTLGGGLGAAAMIGTMGGPVAAIAGIGIAAVSVVKAFDDAAAAAKKFQINKLQQKIETSGEKISQILSEIGETAAATPDQLLKLNEALNTSVNSAIEAGDLSSNRQAGFMQKGIEGLLGAFGAGTADPNRSSARAAIYEKSGFMGLASSIIGGRSATDRQFKEIAPSLAKEDAQIFKAAADQAKQVMTASIMSGKSIDDILNSAEWDKQAEVLARSNAAVQEQILLIQNTSALSEQEKKRQIDNIVAIEAESQARKLAKQVQLQKDLRDLQKAVRQTAFSFTRVMQNMENAIISSTQKLNQLDNSLELAAASASGQAKIGGANSTGIDELINILKNPKAFSSQQRQQAFGSAAGTFGSQSGNIEKILNAGSNIEDTVLQTINKTLADAGAGATDEAVIGQVTRAVKAQLADLEIPPQLADKLSTQVSKAVANMRSSGEDTINLNALTEEVPLLAESVKIFKDVTDGAARSLEFQKSAFDRLAAVTNQQVELQSEANSRLRTAQTLIAKGNIDIKRALGYQPSAQEQYSAATAPVRSMTGGTIDPTQIANQFRNLEQQREQLQQGRDEATKTGDFDAVRDFDSKLKDTTLSLRENSAALKTMADSSELASIAMGEIERVQKKMQAGASIIEKLVTSSPKELATMNKAFMRLNNNMRGITNMGGTAEDRKASLDVFQMIAPLLGNQEGELRANVLQSMLAESGISVGPMMQQVLDTMRNPQSNPELMAATEQYRQATSIQAEANAQLAKINQNLAASIGDKTAEAVKAALKDVTLKFDSQMLSDMFKNINTVPTQNNAKGGLIYKALGGNIDRTVFKPKGTDTVPAMLTPGEFVVNRAATQANLPLLKSINSGKGYQKGGRVKYYNTGGVVNNNFAKDIEGGQAKVSNASDLPIFDSSIIDTDEEVFLKYTKASAFPSYSSSEKNQGLSEFVSDVSDTGKGSGTWLPFLSRDPAEWIDKVRANGINPDDYRLELKKNAQLLAGFAPWANQIGSFKSEFSDGFGTIVEPKIKSIDAPVMTWGNIGLGKFQYEKIGELFSVTDINSFFKKGRLNTQYQGAVLNFPTIDDVLADPAGPAGSIETQIFAIGVAINKLTTMKEAIASITGKVLKESDLDSFNWDDSQLPTVERLYKSKLIVPNKDIEGKIMMPTLTRSEADEPNSVYRGTNANILGGYGNGYFGSTSDGSTRAFQQKFTEIFDPQSRVSPVPPGELFAFTENVGAMITQFEDKKNDLDSYRKDAKNFETTSKAGRSTNQLQSVLKQITEKTTQGLFATIRKDQLNDQWKAKVNDSLQIFPDRPGTQIADFDTRYAQRIQQDRERYQDFVNGKIYPADPDKLLIENTPYAWAGDYGLAERYVATFLDAEAAQAQKEYKSPFQIGDIKTASQDLSFTLDKIQPGSSEKEKAKFSLNYRDIIDMPLLNEKDGYVQPPPDQKLTGIIASIGPASLDALVPFSTAAELSAGGRSGDLVYAQNLEELQAKIKAGYESYIGGDPLARFKLQLARKVVGQQEDTMWIPSGANAYEKLDGESELSVFRSVEAFKQKLLGRGAQAEIVEGAGLDLSGEALGIGQQLVNTLIKPDAILFRNFGLGALANLQAKEQLEPYGQALLQGQQMLGNRIINPRTGMPISPKLATSWGNLGAVGEILTLLAKGKTGTVNAKLGLGVAQQGAVGNADLIGATRKYSQYLVDSALAVLGAGGGAALSNAAGQAVDASTEIEIAGAKLTIQDIFKKVEENSAQSNGALQSNESTPPKSLKDLGGKLFNPYNVFEPGTRPALIDFLVTEMSKFAPGMANPSTPFRKAIDVTKSQFIVQDDFYANPDPTNEPKVNQNIDQANKALLLLTGGVFGLFPNANRIRGMKNIKTEASNQEEQLGAGPTVTASRGGLIYASNGTLVNYQPRGTDTVPAMLTPGEFVVNRRSTQANLPLLKAINSGGANGMSLGGIVNYLSSGGYITPKYYETAGNVSGPNAVSGMAAIPVDAKGAIKALSDGLVQGAQLASQALTNTLQSFGFDSQQLNAINGFVNGLKSVTAALAGINITPEVKFTGTVDVNVNGVQGMTDSMQGVVNSAIQKAMATLKQDNQALDIDPSKYSNNQ